MARKKIKPNEKIILATLKLAETMPWQKVTMNKIAEAAKIENSTLNENFSSKLSILSAFNRQLDEQAMKNFSNITNMGSIREQIFEILSIAFLLSILGTIVSFLPKMPIIPLRFSKSKRLLSP